MESPDGEEVRGVSAADKDQVLVGQPRRVRSVWRSEQHQVGGDRNRRVCAIELRRVPLGVAARSSDEADTRPLLAGQLEQIPVDRSELALRR